MKKQVSKIALTTDKIVSLTKIQAQHLAGGRRPSASGNQTYWDPKYGPQCI